MAQALHIFRKDLRSLRWEIAVALAIVAGHTLMEAGSHSVRYVEWILPAVWIYLVMRVVLEEPLPGDRQFWITRPYRRWSLAVAKALFVAAVVNLPLLISDSVILASHTFWPPAYAGGLLWRQAMLLAMIVLPAAALAAVARNLGQVLLALFGAAALLGLSVYYFTARQALWGPLEWARYLPVALVWPATACLVLLWQYSRRRTPASRTLLAAAVCFTPVAYAAVPWSTVFELHRQLAAAPVPSLDIRLDPARAVQVAPLMETRRLARVSVPVEIVGLAPNQDLQADALHVRLESQGETWEYGWTDAMAISKGPGGNSWADIYVSGAWRAARRQAKLHLAMALTVFGMNEPVAAYAHPAWFPVPHLGACEFRNDIASIRSLECITPLRPPPRTLVHGENAQGNRVATRLRPSIYLASYAPFPADLRIVPLAAGTFYEWRMAGAEKFVFTTERPIAHIVRELEIPLRFE